MTIKLFQRNGVLEKEYELSHENLERIAGMLSKIFLKNGEIIIGYADPFRVEGKKDEYDGKIHDYIYLWTFNNLNEDTHEYNINDGINLKKVNISDIVNIYSILYSHPRWGGQITNIFWIQ